jgi:radical SAM/Cys-rich protein
MDPKDQLALLRGHQGVPAFEARLFGVDQFPLRAREIEILQINVGRRCNLSCRHCHVEAGPTRTEVMSRETLEACLTLAVGTPSVSTIDVTGGAPEMNPHLDGFLREAAKLGRRLIVRSNLAILVEPSFGRFLDLYASLGVEVVASVPDLDRARLERQRGLRVFDKLLEALRQLNARGYGHAGSGLVLGLVHNPIGAYLPAPQEALEAEYRRRLDQDFGVEFNQLFCLTNCPIGRYLESLVMTDNLEGYMRALSRAFNPVAAENVMCRTTLSVGWDGTLYDCDFNQMLSLPVDHGAPSHIRDFDPEKLRRRTIVTDNHCYGCTAGAGSSCQGATAGDAG